MLAGFVVFVLGKPWLENKAEPPNPEVLKQKVLGPLSLETTIYAVSLLGLVAIFFLVQFNGVVGMALNVGIIASLAYIGWFMATKCAKAERERLALAVFLIFGAVVFWTLFEQAGSSLSLFAATNVQLTGARVHPTAP